MRTKLIYALVMVTMMFVTSCKENEPVQPEPPVQSYSVSFNANGGSGTMQVLRGDEGETVTLTANSFTRSDYSFSGWNTKSDGSGTSYADKAKVKLSANLTIYAQWTADAEPTIAVTGITLDKATLTLEPDEFYDPQLVATITPSNATNKKVIWSSSDEDVLYIDNPNGDIITFGGGTATITATTEDGGFTATCKVTVEKTVTTEFALPTGEKFTMVKVTGGTFEMGATPEQEEYAADNESPMHTVTLSTFYIAKFEVTQELWTAVMGTTIEDQAALASLDDFHGKGDTYPMYYIDYDECTEFAEKLNDLLRGQLPNDYTFSLPTEAQWEFAARGGNKTKNTLYAGGNDISDVAWCKDNFSISTHTVGAQKANELGLYDMSGNVSEWCADYYASSYYLSSPENDPICLDPTSNERVLRGGSWIHSASGCRVASRQGFTPWYRAHNFGMRIALAQ